MRANVYSAWAERTVDIFKAHFPQFEKYDKRERGEEPRLLKFSWMVSKKLSCFIVFRPIESEGFDVWLGWSDDGICPFAKLSHCDENNSVNLDAEKMMLPLIAISGRNGLAHWNFWTPSDEIIDNPEAFAIAFAKHFSTDLDDDAALQLVQPAISAAVDELKEFGIPFLKRKVALYECKPAE